MKKGFVLLTVLAVCASLAFIPSMADRARSADRTKAAERVATSDEDMTAIHPVVRRTPLQVRGHNAEFGLHSGQNAASFFDAANQAETRDEEITWLWMVTRFATEDKHLAQAYQRLAGLYEGTAHKQVHNYALALQYADSPELREQLQSRIVELGGDPIAAALTPNGASLAARAAGSDDTCGGAMGIALDWSEIMDINPAGDRNFRVFDVPPGIEAWSVRIETLADPAYPYSDTTLTLWGACGAEGPMGMIAHNDDKDMPNFDYMSLIEVQCLLPGTYYIEVGGYNDIVTVPAFTLKVEKTGGCPIPLPDDYEPDDTRDEATLIGKPTSGSVNGWGFGRYHKMIQAHSLFPDDDADHMHFDLTRPEFTQIIVANVLPTKWNGQYFYPMYYPHGDPYMEVLYGDEPDYGGFCNDPASGYNPYCRTAEDCPPPAGPPNPDYDTCVPIYEFTFGGVRAFWEENPLYWAHDYPGYPGYVTGPRTDICMPPTQRGAGLSASASGGWDLRVTGDPFLDPLYSPPMFNYEVWVRPRYECDFEDEPNNGPYGAKRMTLDQTPYYGIQDASEFFGSGPPGSSWFQTDPDWYAFDVDDQPWNPAVVTIETAGFDAYAVDTGLVLYVGPDDYGYYYDTGLSDDDGGPGFLSSLEVVLPPADELLGNTIAEADYFVDVTTFWLVPNFPYTVTGKATIYIPPQPPLPETEPNDTCETANAMEVNRPVWAALEPACDYDSFTFTLPEDTILHLETNGGDTAMLVELADGTFIACDEDSGGGPVWNSIIDGCLPAGDYCLSIRGWDGNTTIEQYTLDVIATGDCVAEDPPDVTYDGGGNCTNGADSFNNGQGCSRP